MSLIGDRSVVHDGTRMIPVPESSWGDDEVAEYLRLLAEMLKDRQTRKMETLWRERSVKPGQHPPEVS